MGTAKRERQKANKAQREHELARQHARSRSTRIGLLVAGAIVAVFVLVFIAGRFIDDGDDTDDTLLTSEQPEPLDDETATTDAPPDASDTEDDASDDTPATEATVGCPPIDGSDEKIQSFDAPPPMCLDPDATYSALVETSAGDVTIDLDQEQAPNTVNNFVFLARYNYFDDTECHRIEKDFVVQCGDPTATGTGDPGYRFADELPEEGSYELGSVAMANSGPDTNGSQIFIISGPSGTELPPLYSLFGQVPEADLGVVDDMNALASTDGTGAPTEELRILDVTITQS